MQKPNGLTDREQALIVAFSALLMALGIITIPSDLPYHQFVGITFAFLGAIGFSLKEWAGGVATISQASADAIGGFMNFMTQLQVQQKQPQPVQPSIDKVKLAADISSIVLQTLEATTGAQKSAAILSQPTTNSASVS
jgi:hypothetical protein